MRLLLISLVAIALFGCRSKQRMEVKAEATEMDSTILSVSPVLLQKIDYFLETVDTLGYDKDWRVINILFIPTDRVRTKNKNGIWLTNGLFYPEKYSLGYFLYKGKVIAINDTRGDYFNDFIDTVKIVRSIPDSVPLEVNACHEPHLQIYEIISKDSLNLVYNGYL